MEPSSDRDDIEPRIAFDAVVGVPPMRLAAVVLGLGLALGALVWLREPWLVGMSLGWITLAVCFALRGVRAPTDARVALATEAYSAGVAFTIAGVIVVFAGEVFHVGMFDGTAVRVRAEWLAGAMFLLGCAVAFAARRGACVAGQARRAPLDATVATALIGDAYESWGSRRVLFLAFCAAGAAALVRFAAPQVAWLDDPKMFAVPLALGWFCGPVVAITILIGAILAHTLPGIETPAGTSLVRVVVIAAVAGGGLGALIHGWGALRRAHERLGGEERIRLEIGGLGTRLERMTPRTQRQISTSSCVALAMLAAGVAYFLLRADPGIGFPSVVTALVVGAGILCAFGAVFVASRTGAGFVVTIAALVFMAPWIDSGLADLLPWGAEYDAINVAISFAPCAIAGAAVVMHVQQVGARVGTTPLRAQRLVLFAVACAILCVVVWTWSRSLEATQAAFPESISGQLARRFVVDDGLGAAANVSGYAFAVGLVAQLLALPALVAALGMAMGLRVALLVAIGAALGWWARARGTPPATIRGIGIAIALAEIVTYVVFGLTN